jgi:hypothetical protein
LFGPGASCSPWTIWGCRGSGDAVPVAAAKCSGKRAPVSLAFDAMLASNEDVAVFVSGLQVHRNGVRFTAEVRTRKPLFENGDLHSAVHGEGTAGLQLGVELADGRSCVHDWRGFRDPAGAVLSPQSGGGSERHAYFDLFLSPLPPIGSTRLCCAWPWLGIGNLMTLLLTHQILAAAANVVKLCPGSLATSNRSRWSRRRRLLTTVGSRPPDDRRHHCRADSSRSARLG